MPDAPVGGTDDVRSLIRLGRYAEAIRRADQLASGPDRYVAGYAVLQKAAALFNLGRHTDSAATVNRAYRVAVRLGEPVLFAEFHALSAGLAFVGGALDRSATHLVLGGRALECGVPDTPEAVDAHGDLAFGHALMGFHERAATLLGRSLELAERMRLPLSRFTKPDIPLRHALYLDHCGRTAEAAEILSGVVRRGHDIADRYGEQGIRVDARVTFRYAGARLAAMGISACPPEWITPPTDMLAGPEYTALLRYGDACCAIAEGRGEAALATLAAVDVPPAIVSAGEPHQLRALARLAMGDHEAAYHAGRRAFAATAEVFDRARRLFLEAVAIRLDHDELRQTAARYADQAHTDPLTGLPNRRHFERYAAFGTPSTHAVVGVIDLDGFHCVNERHGHLAGDGVLQRVAALMSRIVRRGDLLARVGGDEFVLVLPGTTVGEAEELGSRLVGAVGTEDWEATVPGTPVSVTIGWADLHPGDDLAAAVDRADRTMLRSKQRRPRSLPTTV